MFNEARLNLFRKKINFHNLMHTSCFTQFHDDLNLRGFREVRK